MSEVLLFLFSQSCDFMYEVCVCYICTVFVVIAANVSSADSNSYLCPTARAASSPAEFGRWTCSFPGSGIIQFFNSAI